MIPKIKKIEFMEEYKIKVFFKNNQKKIYNVSRLFRNAEFRPLKNPALFQQAKVDAGGYGISWNDEIDISEYEVWKYGTKL
jgi:hypothetical protein